MEGYNINQKLKKIGPVRKDGTPLEALPEEDQKWILCKRDGYVHKFVTKKLGNKYTFYSKSPGGPDRPLLIKYQEDIDELLSTPLFVEVKKLGDVVEELVTKIETPNVEDELVEVEKDEIVKPGKEPKYPDLQFYDKEELEKLKRKELNEILGKLTDEPKPRSKYDKINFILKLQEKQ